MQYTFIHIDKIFTNVIMSLSSENENDSITLNDTQYLSSQVINNDYISNISYSKVGTSKKNENEYMTNLTDENVKRTTNSKLLTCLSSWGLPDSILLKYEERGIKNMFMWQVECLGNNKVLQHRNNLVYSAPTSAGKTLVAEILALKTLLEIQKKVIIILPFVSVVREKMFYFQDILSTSGIRVEGFMGSHSPPGGFKAVQLAICTIEKANSIVNKLLEENSLDDIGAVIIDEMHLLGDPSRGYLLELLLTKLRYMAARSENIIQLIGMSATLPNLDLLSKWLSAELYTTTFRPIPLEEYYQLTNEIYDAKLNLCRKLKPISDIVEDTDNILQLCLETISKSCSVLIFCPTKNWCENLAQQISVAFRKLGRSDSDFGSCLREQLDSNAISEVLEQLKRCPVGLDAVLQKTVSFGAAFHHAGLTMDERDIIEGAFRTGGIRVLVATSTLSSGVNLPAQRVIVRTPIFHGKPIDSLIYRQMIGRAGRMGKDVLGESILICQKTDKRIAEELMSANLRPIESCLEGAGRLKRAILEVVASGVATTPNDVSLFSNCTLLAVSRDENDEIEDPIQQSVDFLVQNEFIRLQKNDKDELVYVATNLAKACLSSSLPPEDGLALFEEIERARQCFVLDSDLHILYLVTPYSVCNQWANLDWMLYLDIWEKLSPSMRRVAELVGVQESFIFNATRGKMNNSSNKQYHKLQIHRRFYTALALQDLVSEVPLNDVAKKYQCNRGMLQSLQQSASMFAGMVTSFCSQLGWKNVEIIVSQFQDRLQFGIQYDLLDLMKLPNLNGQRARAIFNAGVTSLADLAALDICKLENILLSSVPFESEKEREGETAYDVDQKRKIRGIFITGKQGLTARDAADMLINDARRYLQLEIGAAVLKWDSTQKETSANEKSSTSNSKNRTEEESEQITSQASEIHSTTSNIELKQSNINISANTSNSNSINNYENNIQSINEKLNISANNNNNIKNKTTYSDYKNSTNKLNCENENIKQTCSPYNVTTASEEIAELQNNSKNEKHSMLENFFQNLSNNDNLENNIEEENKSNINEIEINSKVHSINTSEISYDTNIEESVFLDDSEKFGNDLKQSEFENDVGNNNSKIKITETESQLFEDDLLFTTNFESNDIKNKSNLNNINDDFFESFDCVKENDFHIAEKITEENTSISNISSDSALSNKSNYSFTLQLSDSGSTELNNCVSDIKNTDFNWTPFEMTNFSVNSNASQNIKTEILNSSNSEESDTSLFEESICMNSKLNNILDEVSNISKNIISDELMNDNSFFSNINNSYSENIETEMIQNEMEENVNDVVETSQTDITECSFMSNYESSRKSKNKCKKTPRKRIRSKEQEQSRVITQNLFHTPVKKQKVIAHSNLNLETDESKKSSVDTIDLTNINVVNVCENKELFETFCKEIITKSIISLSCACEKIKSEKPTIGQNIIEPCTSNQITKITNNNDLIIDEERLITGFALSCGENFVYFLSFSNETHVNNKSKVKILQDILNNKSVKLRIFDYKEHAKILYKFCKIIIEATVEDPKIADWLLEPEGKEKNLSSMALKYCPEAVGIAQLAGNCKGVGSIALDLNSAILNKIRASVEALVTWHLVESLENSLATHDARLLDTFQTEMKSVSCLAYMEIIGIKIDKVKLNYLISILQEQMAFLQQQAFSLAGRRFSFTSPKEVAKILGMYSKKKVCTNKQTLEQSANPIANVILQWRKLNSTLTKMIFPIIRALKNDRIHGCYVTHSATGRISMHEPNIQNVPRNFDIVKVDKTVVPFSARASFIPSEGKIFLSADYCQLELRLLAHLSQDSILCKIMRKDGDVFKSIAARLNKIRENQVTDVLRQRAKQLCYGIIYGMGTKALSEQLNSTEEEANEFTNSFKITYPKIQSYIQDTVNKCKENGYVITLAGRKRYLPNINHENIAIKSQAERQAVNTTIQGSAADIAKNAMVFVENQLRTFYSNNLNPMEGKTSLVLHLHDELLYEVPYDDLGAISQILKSTMENSVKLSIPFPVKLKTGCSWGDLEEFFLGDS